MAEGRKTFINHTDKTINITAFIREGGSPEDTGNSQIMTLLSGQHAEMIYVGEPGPSGYVFLNGLLIEWQEGSDLVGVSRRVVVRGDAWDNTLNTNSTVTISNLSAGILDAEGSN